MKRWNRTLIATLAALAVGASVACAQTDDTPEDAMSADDRPRDVTLFSGAEYTGGHIKYSYRVQREGIGGYSTTTTEITPQNDGTVVVESSSVDVVSQAGVNIAFYGISLGGLGFRVPTSGGGAIDLSPLEYIEDETLEPSSEMVLPDGGYLVIGEIGAVAGVEVIYATYTHADYSNVTINLALPTDLEIRSILPIFPILELEYEDVTDDANEAYEQPFRMFSSVELIEFIYEPAEE